MTSIAKIRISNCTEFKDKTFKNDHLGSFLTECMRNIQERLGEQLKEKKKDIYEGF